MDGYPVVLNGAAAGRMTVSREGLYNVFDVACRPEETTVFRAFAVGERGELRLGVPVPEHGGLFTVRTRVSVRESEKIGRPLRCELRTAEDGGTWQETAAPTELFRSPELRRELAGVSFALFRRTEGRLVLALPFEPGDAFPLPERFCCARTAMAEGRLCAVFTFDSEEKPLLH